VTIVGTSVRSTVARTIADRLSAAGVRHATGVPCSLLASLFAYLESDESRLDYVVASREDTAVGIASGLTVAGKPTVVLMQNSGLGYCLNVLTSFTLIYSVHLPLIVSWRGHDDNDAVEHDVIGRELLALLDVFGIGWVLFDSSNAESSMSEFLERYDNGGATVALIVREGLSH